MYIRDSDLEAHGYTVGCRRCMLMRAGQPARGVRPTIACRSRIEAAMASAGDERLAQVEIYACGPTPMLKAVASLAARYELPCQVSLEEFMACAVGGCAGCTVRINTPEGPAMKRVCVDGPVFDAATVAW